VAEPKDESKTSTLPDPELNPLLNPLLAANMGRWAEVYFTSPPEKRAQAVSDLLRELGNSAQPERFPAENNENAPGRIEDRREGIPLRDTFAAVEEPAVTCESCGHKNPAAQKFCGMCGTPLTTSATSFSRPVAEQQLAEAGPVAQTTWDDPEAPLPVMVGQHEPGFHEPKFDDDESGARSQSGTDDVRWPEPEESATRVEALFNYRFEPVYRNRIYAGVVLAILLGLLVYMVWRSSSAFRSSGTAPPASPQKATAPREPEPATAAERSAAAPAQPSAKDNPGPASAPATPPTHEQSQPAAESGQDRRTAVHPAPRIVPVTASSSTNATEPGGSEELAMAEKYLNGGPGAARDSRQAATWLWKAVGKKNLTATMLLSDLYLRGDGVPKNCDQARLLLDAAGRKGATAAAERLRNLQAFGCQ